MIEFELKFQIPPDRRAAVRAFVGGRKQPALQPVDLQAIYFDTAQRLLARSGIALRLRHEGTAWVQTLKGLAPDGLGREEYNLTLEGVGDSDHPPDIDPQRHRGVPLGKRLIKLLAANSDAEANPHSGLRCSYRSNVRRLQRHLKTRFGTVELAFDEGHLASEGGRLPICELEIELISGQPMAVIDAARRWAPRFDLWLDTRSKAERGDLLARGLTVAAPRSDIAAIKLREQHLPRAALQTALVSVRNPILANASQIASGSFDDEHVHQLRVMLRRLRVCVRLFDDDPEAAALGRPL
ncbi:MAG: CYTH and CHAD domain-containing protein, partial [Ideonella sp.]